MSLPSLPYKSSSGSPPSSATMGFQGSGLIINPINIAAMFATSFRMNTSNLSIWSQEAALQKIYSALLLDLINGRLSRANLFRHAQYIRGVTKAEVGNDKQQWQPENSPAGESGVVMPTDSSSGSSSDLDELSPYFVYPKESAHRTHHFVEFYIELSVKSDMIFRDAWDFFVTVFDADGNQLAVTLEQDLDMASRLICSFDTHGPGIYKAFVQLDEQPLEGTPIKFSVEREYRFQTILSTVYASSPRKKGKVMSDQRILGIDFHKQTEKIYVTDKLARQVRAFSLDGRLLQKIGGGAHSFQCPTSIAVDEVNKRIIVSDRENNRICFWSTDGEFISRFGKLGVHDGEFDNPWGVDISPDGTRIVVADSGNHRLQIFDKSGNFLYKYTRIESYPKTYRDIFDSPHGVCFDNTGANIYCTDHMMGVIHRFNSDLSEIFRFGPSSELSGPKGVCTDAVGNILVCNSVCHNVKIFTPEGDKLAVMTADQKMYSPVDLAILTGGKVATLDFSGKIYIC